jgi:hypothetical protein
MNREEVIEWVFEKEEFRRFADSLHPDLWSEVMVVLCEMDEEELIEKYEEGWLDGYVYRTIKNMGVSSTSKFCKLYRPAQSHYAPEFCELIIDIADESDIEELQRKELLDAMVVNSFEKCFPQGDKAAAIRAVFFDWLNGTSVQDMSKDSGIPERTVYEMIYRVIRTIRKDIIGEYYEGVVRNS